METPGAAESARAYASGRAGGSSAAPADEVWLRGNMRPVVGLGAVAVGGAALATASTALAGGPAWLAWLLTAATGATALAAVALAVAAAGPRLGRRGPDLLLRLSPWRTDAVPLAVVECVFAGSQPLDGAVLRHVHAADADPEPAAGRRVGTLVIRFAERATAWRERTTFAPWGTWHDGHAILDGRWCEPLSAAAARAVGQRLLEAKREVATEPAR